jgi:hypothetical protein
MRRRLHEPTRALGLGFGFCLALAACDSADELVIDDLAEGDDAEDPGEGPPSDLPSYEPRFESESDLESEPEPCASQGETRTCDGDGTQFCFKSGPDLIWGECLSTYVCEPFVDKKSCTFEGMDMGSVGCSLGPDGVPEWGECPDTPLVLSFDGGPVEFSSSAAAFEVGGPGMCSGTDWPTARTPWLAIDLDGNGFIDGGHELFGSGTVLPDGARAAHGFAALAALDSNADGKIDAADARFAELLLWHDHDGDKLSMPGELTPLTDAGVEAIELDYTVDERCDARANCERERARFAFTAAGERRVGEVVDVYLPCQ